MRFIFRDYTGRSRLYTAEEAVERQCDEQQSNRDGELERMRERATALEGILGRLLDYHAERATAQADREALAEVLGSSWEMTDGDCREPKGA